MMKIVITNKKLKAKTIRNENYEVANPEKKNLN